MTAPTLTTTLVAIGNREDLSDTIYRVAPEETPFMNQIERVKASGITHEWQTEALATPDATLQALEGDVASLAAVNVTTRLGNLCQINRIDYGVSGSQEAVKKAGRSNELTRLRVLHGIEKRRDAEKRFIGNYASVAESGATTRKSGGALAALTSNVSYGAGGSSGGISAAAWTAATPGTARTFTETLLKTVLSSGFSNGARPSIAYMGPTQKQQASSFTGIASIRTDATGKKMATIVAGADGYVSDFGVITFVPHPYGLTADVLLIDPNYWAVATLRGWTTEPLAKSGDSEQEMLLAEHTLECRNEKSSSKISALA